MVFLKPTCFLLFSLKNKKNIFKTKYNFFWRLKKYLDSEAI